MLRLRYLAACALVAAGCHSLAAPSTPAASGVRAYVDALRSTDAHAAYAMLADDVKKKVTFDQFALAWKDSQQERAWQAKELEESLKGSPDVGERAVVAFRDGKLVQLEREGKTWRLESELVSRTKARLPRDAVRAFADAIAERDIARILGTLSTRRREGIQRQVEGFVNGIGRHANDELEQVGARATLRWDDNGIAYELVLRKEDDGEWRVDDLYIRPKKDDQDAPAPARGGGEILPEDF